MPSPSPLTIHVVTHTHWDREWYLPAGRFRQRLVALIDDVLAQLPTPGESFLLDGQAVVIEDYLAVRPERRDELAARLRDGSIEAGPWYVLADELIPSGEALVRNLLVGRAVLRALGADPPPVLYSPDAFGHPAALPILASQFGFPLIVLWRGLGGDGWPEGDTFRWCASDGSCALVHHLPRAGYEYGSNLPASEPAMREWWRAARAELGSRSRLGVLLVLNGADHHAVQPDLHRALELLSHAASPDVVVHGSLSAAADEIVRRAEQLSIANPREIPEINGELRRSYGYTWALQGTFATRAGLKRRNALAERLLVRDAEPWAALAARHAGRARCHLTHAAWKALLRCHPHDTLCGCSTDDVARAMAVRLDDADTQARGIRDDALLDLMAHDPVAARTAPERWRPVVIVRNRAARVRGGVAELELCTFRQHVPVGPNSGTTRPTDAPPPRVALDGGRGPLQVLDRSVRHDRVESPAHYPDDDLVDVARVVAWVEPVAGYGLRALPHDVRDRDPRGVQPPASVHGGATWLENEALRVEITSRGEVQLHDRTRGRTIPSLVRFEDVGDAGDLYTHSPIAPIASATRFLGAEVRHAGPLRGELVASWRLDVPSASDRSGRSAELVPIVVRCVFTLDAGAPFVRVSVTGHNAARDHRLRIVFGTAVANASVFADAAFGAVRRQPIEVSDRSAAAELPPRTAPLHRYVTLVGDRDGATVFSDGLAEYEATDAGDVAITLVRAVGELSRNDLPERPGHAGWPVTTPEAQCGGPFAGEFAVMLHGARDSDTIDAVERAADDVLLPLTGTALRSALTIPEPVDGVTLEGRALAFSACKESEDGDWMVLRCVNLSDEPTSGRWRLGFPVREARWARIDETLGDPASIDSGSVPFDAPPRAVVTLLVR